MRLLPWRDCSMTLRQNGSASGWLLGLLVTPRCRRYRLSGGCPISLWVCSRSVSLSRPTKHLPLSTVHLLSRCNNNSPRDSRFCLVRGREQAWCLFQVWQGRPLCSRVSTELACAVFPAFSQLSSGQVDDYQEEVARKLLWTSQLH